MIDPALDLLLQKVDSKYTLVVLAAKRARQLTEGSSKMVESQSGKPVSVALQEIAQDKVKYEKIKTSIRQKSKDTGENQC